MRLRSVGAFKNIRDAKGNAFGPHTHHQDTLLLFPDPHYSTSVAVNETQRHGRKCMLRRAMEPSQLSLEWY